MERSIIRKKYNNWVDGTYNKTVSPFNFKEKIKRKAIWRTCYVKRRLSHDNPAKHGMPFEEVNFYSKDSIKLHGWYIPAAKAKATIILAHGYSAAKTSHLHVAEWLWQDGYNVFMYDFRSHGYSEGEYGTSVGYMERLDVLGAVDYLLQRGDKDLGILGVSMGGSAAILAAAECPQLKAIVADSPYAHLYRSISNSIKNYLSVPAPRFAWAAFAKFVLSAVAEHHGFEVPISHPANYIHLIAPRPLFLLHGEADSLTELENGMMLYMLAGEPKQLWTVPGMEHAQLDKVMPEEYRRRILEFFNNVTW